MWVAGSTGAPTGTVFVTEGPENSGLIDIRDADTGASVRSFHGHDDDVNDVVFSSDGSMLATTGDDGAVRVWDPTTGERLFEVQHDYEEGGPPVGVNGPSFSPDGTRFAAVWRTGVVRVIDVDTGDVDRRDRSVRGPAPTSAPTGSGSLIGRPSVVDANLG